MTAKDIRRRRIQAGVSGDVVCQRSGVCRSRLSYIERGYVTPKAMELESIETALRELVEARDKVRQVAHEVGWPVAALA